jgi:carboxymethylenebutenolidase
VAAVVDMYGIHPNVKPDYSRMRAAVLALFAGDDEMVDETARQNLDQQLRANGVRYQAHVYPGVDHAFMNDERPDVYDPATVQDAWRRILDFFRTELAGTTT